MYEHITNVIDEIEAKLLRARSPAVIKKYKAQLKELRRKLAVLKGGK